MDRMCGTIYKFDLAAKFPVKMSSAPFNVRLAGKKFPGCDIVMQIYNVEIIPSNSTHFGYDKC